MMSRTQQALDDLCEECKDIFSLHQGDIGHSKLCITDIDTRDHPSICKNLIRYP